MYITQKPAPLEARLIQLWCAASFRAVRGNRYPSRAQPTFIAAYAAHILTLHFLLPLLSLMTIKV